MLNALRCSCVLLLALIYAPSASAQVDPPGDAVRLTDVTLSEHTLRVHFIDIGGGLGALVETPGGKHILIDGGKFGGTRYDDYVAHFVDDGPIDEGELILVEN